MPNEATSPRCRQASADVRRTLPCSLVALVAAVLVAASLGACSSDDSSDDATAKGDADTPTTTAIDARLAVIAEPSVEGPITGGRYEIPYLAMPEGWAEDHSYTEDEYFVSGDAVAYDTEGELGLDGRWTVAPGDQTAPFTTRIVVRRPVDPADFSGTVVVEWLNVTAGRDSDPDFGFLADRIFADGDAYVAVSAQRVGVEPGGLGMEVPGVPPEALAPLKTWDPERYAPLSHPGDPYSYDMYSQATRGAIDAPLDDLDVERIVAVGESQSAYRLASYANGVQPVTNLFDGILIHSRGAGAAEFAEEPEHPVAPVVHIRDDLDIPVLQFATETDLFGLGFAKARQDDTDRLRTWEVAGTAHADQATLDYGIEAGHRWSDVDLDLSTACGSINDGPQQPVVQTAYEKLEAWITDGQPPATGPRIEVADGAIARDPEGIAVGGIRTPPVDAPVSVLTGDNPTDKVICSLFGSSTPLTAAQLTARYADHDTYVEQVTASADQALDDGFILRDHADAFVAEAEQRIDVP